MAIYCPQGSGTLRQQLLMMQGIAWYGKIFIFFKRGRIGQGYTMVAAIVDYKDWEQRGSKEEEGG